VEATVSERRFLPGKFTDLTEPRQLGTLNDILTQLLAVTNAFDQNSFALAWLEGATAGQVIASKGVTNPPEWDASPSLTGATFSGLTASTLVATNASKALVSDTTNYVIGVGTNTITVGAVAPVGPAVGDIWVDTSA
jgi:hypothetical protein